MINVAVQKEAFTLAGLLSKVMVQTLAKLSMLNLSKPDIESGSMMTNDDARNLTKPHIEKCVTGCMEGFIAVTMRGSQGLSGVTTREELSFVTSTRAEFSDPIKKGSHVNAALWSCVSVDHAFGVSALALDRAISTIALISSPALVPISSIFASDASAPLRFDISLFSSLSFSWRRSISPCIAATMKPALLSPFNFTPSMPSSTSCGMRAVTDWDFALVEPVAINQPSVNWCLTVYTKVNYTKELMCKPLGFIFNYTLSTGKAQAPHKIVRPRSARTHAGPLTTSDRISIEVAVMNITTPPQGRDSLTPNKFTWRFLALSANTRNVIHITATTEREARDQSPDGCVMVFAGRLPVQEMSYVA